MSIRLSCSLRCIIAIQLLLRIIAAPASTEFSSIQWGAYEKNVSGTNTGIGTGKQNTQAIVSFLRSTGESGRAAQLCASLNFGGFNDWFLPSIDEFSLMYQNLHQNGLGGFGDTTYWSSSQITSNYALVLHFGWHPNYGSGFQAGSPKSDPGRVRAIRAF